MRPNFPNFLFVLTPFLERNHLFIKRFIVCHKDFLLIVTNNNTGISPGEVIKMPERVEGNKEGEQGNSEDIDDQPSNGLPLSFDDKDKCLKTVNDSQKNQRNSWESLFSCRDNNDQVDQINDRSGKGQSTKQIHENYESH